MSDKEEQESQAAIPLVQDTVLFSGHPLVVVRFADGQPGVVLRWVCENLHLSPAAQHELSGKPYGALYESLKAAFGVPRYDDIPDQEWPRVVHWFRVQLEQWRNKWRSRFRQV